jgi:hypothetical protein
MTVCPVGLKYKGQTVDCRDCPFICPIDSMQRGVYNEGIKGGDE